MNNIILIENLNALVGEEVTDIYFESSLDTIHSQGLLEESLDTAENSGVKLKTKSNKIFIITNSDYPPFYGFEGIKIIDSKVLLDPNESHQADNRLTKYFNTKIKDSAFFYHTYSNQESLKEIQIPVGFKLSFSNNYSLHFLCLTLRHYNQKTNELDYYFGESITMFFNENILKSQGIYEKLNIIL